MIEDGQVAAVVLRSPSAVRALAAHVYLPDDVPLVCAGRTTADAAAAAGFVVAAVSESPSSAGVAQAVSELFRARGLIE
jgi:uroporphyrinogen-III synthase